MNKNSVLGLVFIGAIIVGFSVYSNKQTQEQQAERRRADSVAYANARVTSDTSVQHAIANEIAKAVSEQQQTFPEEFYTIENDVLTLTLSNKGGRVRSARVKNYTTYSGDSLTLMNDNDDYFSLQFYTDNSSNFETGTLQFVPQRDIKRYAMRENEDEYSFTLRHTLADNRYVDYVYTLRRGSYMVDFDINTVGLNNVTNVDLQWVNNAHRQEKAFDNENNYTTIAYRYPNEDGIEEMSIGKGNESEDVKVRLHWFAFKQQFFSSFLVAQSEPFGGARLEYQTYGEQHDANGLIKQYSAFVQIPYKPHQDQKIDLAFYFGPNKYSILKSYDQKFEAVVPLGSWIIGWVNRFLVIPIFDMLEKHIVSYGLIILILTLIIKLLLFPLTFKSYMSSAKMRILKPDVDRIAKKYPSSNDAMKKQQETMALYKKTGVSPMGGCLPILIQFPILIALFRFFPASIELRQQPFLWADDLSAYDSILNLPFSIPFYGDHVSLFTLLMAAALYISSRMNMSQTPDTGMPGMKFMMLYMMPIMLLMWFNSYSAGLSYYYCLSNIITIAQNLITRRMVDESKLHARLKENSKKPVKKSTFQAKLETMAKRAQQQNQQQRKRK